MEFRVDLKGLDVLQHFLRVAPDAIEPLAEAALYEEAQVIFARSQVLVPVRFGALKGSGNVSQPIARKAGETVVEITYGGPAAKYALWVHEKKFYANGDPYERGKYLSRPVEERLPRIAQNIAKRVESMLRQALGL